MKIGFVLSTERTDQYEIMQKVTEVIKHITELGFMMDSVACVGMEKQIELRMEMDSIGQGYQTLSNILKKLKEAEDEIIKHIK